MIPVEYLAWRERENAIVCPWERWDCIGVNPTANRSGGFTAAQTGYYPETFDVLWTGAEAHYSPVNNFVTLY